MGDIVVALVKDDPRFPQREVGTVKAVDGDTITVEIKATGEVITQERKKVDKPLETHPSQMWDRMAKAIVEVEDEAEAGRARERSSAGRSTISALAPAGASTRCSARAKT